MTTSSKLTVTFTDADDVPIVRAFLEEKGFTITTPKKLALAIEVAPSETETYRAWLGRILPGFTLAGAVEVA